MKFEFYRKKGLLCLLITMALAFSAQGQSAYCVGPTATGNGSGADWNNLKAWSSTPARGDTWYLVGGTYSGKTFNTAASGTTVISILKATTANYANVTATGWNPAAMSTQAVFTGVITLAKGYLVFDGQVPSGTSWDENPGDYGFRFADGLCKDVVIGDNSGVSSTYTVSHVAGVAYSGDPANDACPYSEKFFLASVDADNDEIDNVTVSYCLADGWQNCVAMSSANQPMKNWVIEHNVFLNGSYYSDAHGECINEGYGYIQNTTIRFNLFKASTGTCIIAVTLNYNSLNTYIYGNVFSHCSSGNGIIGIGSGGLSATGINIYNNTFDTISGGPWLGMNASGYTFINCAAANNLFYNCPGGAFGVPAGVSVDYSAYFSCSGNNGDAHIQTGSGNPFINEAGDNYELLANTIAGANLGAPNNVDPNGDTRTTWTRGTF